MEPEVIREHLWEIDEKMTLKEDIKLYKLLSELKVHKNDRVIIYDESENTIFDSEYLETIYFYEYWKLLGEKVYRFLDMPWNGKRYVFIFMSP